MSDYLQSGIILERSKVSMTVTGKKKYTHGTRATGYSAANQSCTCTCSSIGY